MKDLMIFNNPEFGEIRTIEEDGRVLFCGADVAKALGYAKPQNAVATHCRGALKRGILTNGGEQEMSFIPESDLYGDVCSLCDWDSEREPCNLPYCPNCGAKMDGGE